MAKTEREREKKIKKDEQKKRKRETHEVLPITMIKLIAFFCRHPPKYLLPS